MVPPMVVAPMVVMPMMMMAPMMMMPIGFSSSRHRAQADRQGGERN
jgi:hypothetical protein